MAKKIEAYEASDGSLHKSAETADEHSCKVMLEKCLSNQGLVNEVMNNARCVYDALHFKFGEVVGDGQG